ncbi:MAG: hypothetical protein LBL47_01625 [Lactobacillus sp.]|jgi:hypothetical protein|nr:hypothetical protein [Lactobacillus sp.]
MKHLSETCLQYRNYFIEEIEKLPKKKRASSVEYKLFEVFSLLHISFDEAAIHGKFNDTPVRGCLRTKIMKIKSSKEYATYVAAKGRSIINEHLELALENISA